MILKHLKTDRIPIPGEDGQWMVFRRLNPRRLQEAMDARSERGMAALLKIGAEELRKREEIQAVLRELRAKAAEPTPATVPVDVPAAPAPDPLVAYDLETLLIKGIESWSYETPIAETLQDEDGGVDLATMKWAGLQILKYNDRLPEAVEADLKN